MVRIKNNPAKGITAIELLLVTSILAIITVFASSTLSSVLSPSELQRGIDITESSVKQARQTARFYNTDVLLRVGQNSTQDQQTLTLLIPRMQRTPAMNEVTVSFILPKGVHVSSQEHVIHFMPNGEVEPPSDTLTIFDQIQNESRQLALVE